MKRKLLTLLILAVSTFAFAQLQPAPKFASKAQKAILSVNTYDKNGDLMKSGNAFFVDQNGVAMADYSLFKNAYKAIAIDASGKQYDVESILGADDTYSVVRFHVNVKGNSYLTPASYIQESGSTVYALNYSKDKVSTCPQATIENFDSIDAKYAYYKFSADLGKDYVGGPVLNQNGEVIGILQSALGQGTNLRSYAMDIRFKEELKISAIQSRSATLALNSIYISKGIPDTQEECLVYAYFKSRNTGNAEYLDILNRMIAAYPQCVELYYRRSIPYIDTHRFDEADADLQKYLQLNTDKAYANFIVGQSIYNKLQYIPEVPYEKWTAELALEYVNKAIELEEPLNREESPVNKVKFREQKAIIQSFRKDYDDAIRIYEELNTGEHRSPSYYYAISLAHEARGDSASVIIADLDSAINMFGTPLPTEAANYVLRRGQVLAKFKNYRKAVLDYNQYAYLVNSQVSDVFYYDRSQLEMEGHMYQQAMDDIESAVNKAPNNTLYVITMAGMYLQFGKIDECIAACNDVIRLNPDIPEAYRYRGYAYVQKKDMANARASLQKAIDLGDTTSEELMKTYVK